MVLHTEKKKLVRRFAHFPFRTLIHAPVGWDVFQPWRQWGSEGLVIMEPGYFQIMWVRLTSGIDLLSRCWIHSSGVVRQRWQLSIRRTRVKKSYVLFVVSGVEVFNIVWVRDKADKQKVVAERHRNVKVHWEMTPNRIKIGLKEIFCSAGQWEHKTRTCWKWLVNKGEDNNLYSCSWKIMQRVQEIERGSNKLRYYMSW